MTISVTKKALNVREKLAELDKPTGIAGEAMLRADTPQEQQALVGFSGKRNYLFNGAMKVSQRGTSFTTTTAAGGYTLDRWYVNGDSAVLTVTQEAVSDLGGFEDSIKISPNATATPSNAHHSFVQQLIEAQDCTTFGYGLSGANHLTLSFWYKSNDTSTRVLWLYNPDSGRHYAQSFAPKSGGTWERIQFLIPPDTSGGFGNDNNVGLYVRIVFSAGSDFTGGMPNTGWTSISNARYEGVANLFSDTSNYIQITGVQLELGKVATPFEHRSYGEELALCQRYYQRLTAATNNAAICTTSLWTSGTSCYGVLHLPTELRTAPTVSFSGTFVVFSVGSTTNVTSSGGGSNFNGNSVELVFNHNAIGSAGNSAWIRMGSTGNYVGLDAEL